MLIRFTVENFLSFRDEVEFSMIAGKARQHPSHVIAGEKRGEGDLLKSAVIYGANASGKSNLIKAMDFARQVILEGTRPRQRIAVTPFRFDPVCADKPSTFQFEFKHKGKAYIYGFSLDTMRIHEEWLYEINGTKEKMLFERQTDDEETKVEYSEKLNKAKPAGFLQLVATATRPNQLLLTNSIELNAKQFETVFDWFAKVLVLVFPESRRHGLALEMKTDDEFKSALEQFLCALDTGIASIDLQEMSLDEETAIPEQVLAQLKADFMERMPEWTSAIIGSPAGGNIFLVKDENGEPKSLRIMTAHPQVGSDEVILLDVSEESDGTQRLFDLIPALVEMVKGERVFVIDEFDRSLHPHLSYKILELFLTNAAGNASQMIVTTHESHLLNLDLLRRDEIWFIQKNAEGVSSVYSLEEYAPRYDKDIEKGYLLGRFGAIPLLGSTADLKWMTVNHDTQTLQAQD